MHKEKGTNYMTYVLQWKEVSRKDDIIHSLRMQVQVEVVQIESDDTATAIADEIDRCNINTIVIGASATGGILSR